MRWPWNRDSGSSNIRVTYSEKWSDMTNSRESFVTIDTPGEVTEGAIDTLLAKAKKIVDED